MSIENGYLEVDHLFIEWEIDRTRIDIINVQLPDQKDPKNEERWIDTTDHLTDGQIDQLREQVNEYYIDEYHKGVDEP